MLAGGAEILRYMQQLRHTRRGEETDCPLPHPRTVGRHSHTHENGGGGHGVGLGGGGGHGEETATGSGGGAKQDQGQGRRRREEGVPLPDVYCYAGCIAACGRARRA